MYGKPQPIPFTRTFFCQDCSNQFRDLRVQSVLDYPPPHSAPLFWLVSRKPCMDSPNQYLSPEPSFTRIAPTSFEIQGSKVCSTIRPLTLRHCFGTFHGNHVSKAPTSTFHQNLLLPGLLQPVSRSKGPKCARLSAPSLCATVLVGCKETMYGKPQPVPFTRTFFWQDCSNQFRDPRVQSVLDYPPPHSAPLLWLVARKPSMESPSRYLAPEPSFARIAPTSFEIQGSKVCSTIRPLTLRHCFGWFQGNHVWKAPTSTFHQNLLLPGLLQPVSRSKGPKCARLSAPSLCATVVVGCKETIYGKPQPVPCTRTFFCQDCSNQFRDPRVQSVPDYPHPHSAALFWLVSRKPCMESPNQYLSPQPSFARIAPTSFEIQGSKVCSTIRPLTLRHCCGWWQEHHVWKAPASTFHQNLLLPRLLQPVSRSKGPKCARLSAPSLCATVLVGFKETMYGKPQPVPFTRTFFCQDCSNQFRDPRVQSVLDYPPLTLHHCFGWFQGNHVWKAPTSTFHQNLLLPGLLQPVSRSKGPKCARLSAPSLCATVVVGCKETMYRKPQPVPFTRTFFCQDCSNQFRDPRVQSVLDYQPPHSAPLLWLVARKPSMESPSQYLAPEPSFARIAPTSFEIQGSKVCLTIRTLTLRHCFGWFQGNHVWKTPTSTFHHNLLLPGLLQPVSRSKGPKCARLSAPSLCATVVVGGKSTMYGKPQPVPFTRTFFCQDCSNQFRDPRVQSVLDYPPPPSAPLFWLVSRKPCMESPNQYLSPEPFFARIAPTSFEMQGSKVCSTIRPLPLRHCFGWFQGNHVWKAPASTFHQNLLLPGLLQPVSRSKGPKCARLSAPHSAPLFWLVSRKPCMESPNQYLAPEPSFARIAPTSFEI